VTGDVQGVGFRSFVQDRASGFGLAGWVRNTWDGKVEGEAEGPVPAILELSTILERGPISSHVDSLVAREIPLLGETGPFRITR
jgi:acylphosphatase